MRRMAMLLGVTMLLVVVAAGTALAVTKTCKDTPCFGTANADLLYERVGNMLQDRIYGLEGDDVIDANNFNQDSDRLRGDGGRDRLLSNDGDGRDIVYGGPGRDICYVDRGDLARNCESVRR